MVQQFRVNPNHQHFLVIERLKIPIRPRSVSPLLVRQADNRDPVPRRRGFETVHLAACGLTPDITCLMVPSAVPAASGGLKDKRQRVGNPERREYPDASASSAMFLLQLLRASFLSLNRR